MRSSTRPRKKSFKAQVLNEAQTPRINGRKTVQPSQIQNRLELRRAHHCTRCPGRPLRSQCSHTQVGRDYIAEQNLRLQVATLTPSLAASRPPGRSPGVADSFDLGVDNPPGLNLPLLVQPSFNSSPVLESSQNQVVLLPPAPLHFTPQTMRVPTLLRSSVLCSDRPLSQEPHASTDTTHGLSLGHTPLTTAAIPIPIVSCPLGDLTSGVDSQSRAAASRDAFDSSEGVPGVPSPGSFPFVEATNVARPTAQNPVYGTVQGVLRGATQDYNIVRKRKLPSSLVDSKKASKKFRDTMNTIVRKCEELSVETSCWLFIGAQHAAASGGAIHYASPRLKKDGTERTNDMATDFLELIKRIADSRRIDTMELQQSLQNSEERNSLLNRQIIELESRIQIDQEKYERDTALIQDYEQRLGISTS